MYPEHGGPVGRMGPVHHEVGQAERTQDDDPGHDEGEECLAQRFGQAVPEPHE